MKKPIVFMFTFFLSSYSFATGQETHGGGAWDCGLGQPVQLVDFYEAIQPKNQTGLGLNIPPSNASVDDQVSKALSRLAERNPVFASRVKTAYKLAFVSNPKNPNGKDQITSTPGGIAPPDDIRATLKKPGCTLVGAAKYVDHVDDGSYGTLLWDDSIINNMSNTDQAGLRVHEAIYRVARDFGAVDSRSTRILVGYLFSDLTVQQFPQKNLNPKPMAGIGSNFPYDGAFFDENQISSYWYPQMSTTINLQVNLTAGPPECMTQKRRPSGGSGTIPRHSLDFVVAWAQNGSKNQIGPFTYHKVGEVFSLDLSNSGTVDLPPVLKIGPDDVPTNLGCAFEVKLFDAVGNFLSRTDLSIEHPYLNAFFFNNADVKEWNPF